MIASLSSEEVRKNITDVLRQNPLPNLPEKEVLLAVLESLYELASSCLLWSK